MIEESLRKSRPSRRLLWLACWPAVCCVALIGCASKAPQVADEPSSYPPWVCGLSHNKDRWQCLREGAEPAPAAVPSAELDKPAPAEPPSTEPATGPATSEPQPAPVAPAVKPASDEDTGNPVAEAHTPPESADGASAPTGRAWSTANSQRSASADRADEKSRLMALPPDYFAIQAGAFPNPEALRAHIVQYGIEPAYQVRLVNGGRVFHVLILQVHDSRRAAQAALANLPQPLNGMDLWIRSVGSLHDAMRADDAPPDDGSSPSSPQ